MNAKNPEFWVRGIDTEGEVGTWTFQTEAERDAFRLGWESAGGVTLSVGDGSAALARGS